MILRDKHGSYEPMFGKSFASVLSNGFDDGTQPTFDDWLIHLSGIYTDIRLLILFISK
jgi:gamma-glutamylcysteine synthetase